MVAWKIVWKNKDYSTLLRVYGIIIIGVGHKSVTFCTKAWKWMMKWKEEMNKKQNTNVYEIQNKKVKVNNLFLYCAGVHEFHSSHSRARQLRLERLQWLKRFSKCFCAPDFNEQTKQWLTAGWSEWFAAGWECTSRARHWCQTVAGSRSTIAVPVYTVYFVHFSRSAKDGDKLRIAAA